MHFRIMEEVFPRCGVAWYQLGIVILKEVVNSSMTGGNAGTQVQKELQYHLVCAPTMVAQHYLYLVCIHKMPLFQAWVLVDIKNNLFI